MSESAEIKRLLVRVDSKLTALLNKPKKETWVKAGVITDLTGWKGKKLYEARQDKLIKYREVGEGAGKYVYLIESLNPVFLKTGTNG